jgi:hypothetical protein
MRRQHLLLASLGLMTLWRLALLPTLGLSPEEAFTAMRTGQPLSADFTLQGPLLAWLSRLSMLIGGHGEFGLRLFAPLLALATSLMAWHLAARHYDRTIAGWTVVVLNLLPGFNLAAVSWTPAIVVLTGLTALPLLLPRAIAFGPDWSKAWTFAGLCVAALLLTSPGLAPVLALSAFLLYRPSRHSALWRGRGFWLFLILSILPLILWVRWQSLHHWPFWDHSLWMPDLRIIPSWFRAVVFASPLLFVVILWAVRGLWLRPTASATHSLILAYALPLALADFFWRSQTSWPDTGWPAWLVFASMLAGHQFVVSPLLQTEDRISWRTITLVLAALQSVFLVNTDFVRAAGLPWSFESRLDHSDSPFLHLFTRDPSGTRRGWTQTGRLVADVLIDTQLNSPQEGRYFVIASHWRLAAALNQALPADAPCLWPSPTHPRVHPIQNPSDWTHPFAHLPRYDARQPDGSSLFAQKDALYVTDDSQRSSPPPAIRSAFTRTELLTTAHVVHAGQPVRQIKIFACYGYQPPQL